MPDDSGNARHPGSGRSFVPPVFTWWGGEKPADRPTEDGAASAIVHGGESTARAEATPAPEIPTGSVEGFVPAGEAITAPTDLTADLPEPDGEAGWPAGSALTPFDEPARATDLADLADRIERFAAGLRANGRAALEAGLRGDERLDAVLAAVLSGYLAALDE